MIVLAGGETQRQQCSCWHAWFEESRRCAVPVYDPVSGECCKAPWHWESGFDVGSRPARRIMPRLEMGHEKGDGRTRALVSVDDSKSWPRDWWVAHTKKEATPKCTGVDQAIPFFFFVDPCKHARRLSIFWKLPAKEATTPQLYQYW